MSLSSTDTHTHTRTGRVTFSQQDQEDGEL